MDEAPLEHLESEITLLYAHLSSALCRWLLKVAEYDRREGWATWGMVSCAAWLNWKCGISLRTARDHVRVARALEDLPIVTDAFARGELSYSKVRAITRVATAETEAALVLWAAHGTAAHIERVVGTYRRHESREELDQAIRRHQAQSFSSTVRDDGCYRVTIVLPPEDGARLVAEVEAEAKRIKQIPEMDVTLPIEARRAQAFMALYEGARTDGSAEPSEPVQLVVHADAALLAGTTDQGRCEIEGGPAIPPETARRLGCSASVFTLIERSGNPIWTGDNQRLPGRRMRRLLRARDNAQCQFPGCTETVHLIPHHARHYARGGRTRLRNLVSLCRFHHWLVHEGGFSVESARADEFLFRRPDGRVVTVGVQPSVRFGEREVIAANRDLGLDISPTTIQSRWAGEPLDLDSALGYLQDADDARRAECSAEPRVEEEVGVGYVRGGAAHRS